MGEADETGGKGRHGAGRKQAAATAGVDVSRPVNKAKHVKTLQICTYSTHLVPFPVLCLSDDIQSCALVVGVVASCESKCARGE